MNMKRQYVVGALPADGSPLLYATIDELSHEGCEAVGCGLCRFRSDGLRPLLTASAPNSGAKHFGLGDCGPVARCLQKRAPDRGLAQQKYPL